MSASKAFTATVRVAAFTNKAKEASGDDLDVVRQRVGLFTKLLGQATHAIVKLGNKVLVRWLCDLRVNTTVCACAHATHVPTASAPHAM